MYGRLGELIVILLLGLIFFGAGKIPRFMEDIGRGWKNLRKGIKEGEEEVGKVQKEKNIEDKKTKAKSQKKND